MEENLVMFSTAKINNIKRLFDILKEIEDETPFIFKEDGIYIYISDSDNIVKIKLDRDSFEEYSYNSTNSHETCIFSSRQVYPILKSVNNSHSVSFKMGPQKEELVIESVNSEKDEKEVVAITLLDVDQEEVSKKLDNFSMKFSGLNYSLDCSKLIEVVKKFNSTGCKTMKIKSYSNFIEFYCEPENNLDILYRSIRLQVPDPPEQTRVYDSRFYLKPIYYFVKSMNSNKNNYNNVDITLTSIRDVDHCVVSYQLGDFGTMYLISRSIGDTINK